MLPVKPYGTTGATNALRRGAISRAMATGARMSAPFAVTPCGSNVPSGRSTVVTFAGTYSRNSIQLIRSSSRVVCAAAPPAVVSDSAMRNPTRLNMLRFVLSAMRQIPLAAIRDAASSVYPVVTRTPLVQLPLTPELATHLDGAEIYLKLEVLQPIGSFKIRGAWNVVRQLSRDALRDGIWTVSAGNAAQGVALAARTAGVPCSVMVMDTAPQTKLQAIERLGAAIVPASYDECWRTVEAHGSERMRGRFIHPFDDDRFIAGNGTAGLEIVEDLPDVDTVVAPLGGGGLLAGVASALLALR